MTISCACFVPAQAPYAFQFVPLADTEESLQAKQKHLLESVQPQDQGELSRQQAPPVFWRAWLAKGDRRLAPLLF